MAQPAPARGGGTGGLAWLLVAALAVATLLAGFVGLLAAQLGRPGPAAQTTTVIVPAGTSVAGIAELLMREGVTAPGAPFVLGVRLLAGDRPLHAGEFAFPARTSALAAIRILQQGTPVAHRLTVPEGATVTQVLELVAAADGLAGTLATAPDEGRLLPETYYYTRGDTADELIERMTGAMDDALAELWPGRAASLPLRSQRDAVILASIVEKETSVPEERPIVAGVFINRLRRGMKLQADPTVAYAVSGGSGLDRPLTRADLQIDSPYNTYLYAGLPPGPIANPGRAAIEAVLRPAATRALYFVADGKGGHVFAETLAEHNANVARYRALQR